MLTEILAAQKYLLNMLARQQRLCDKVGLSIFLMFDITARQSDPLTMPIQAQLLVLYHDFVRLLTLNEGFKCPDH